MIYFLWLNFIIAAILLSLFGYKAAKLGLAISKISFFSETFIGMIFLASCTFMPELFTSIGSAGLVNSADLASGNVFGTLVINLTIIGLIDIRRKKSIYINLDNQHIFTGLLNIVLLTFFSISIILRNFFTNKLSFYNIGLDSILIFLICIFLFRLIFRFDKKYRNNGSKREILSVIKKEKIILWIKFFVYIFFVGISGLWISLISDKIVLEIPNLSHAYFGSVFLALTSSLPEIIVSFSSVSLGSINMAVGNILGSNLFNMIIIPVSDIFYKNTAILSNVSFVHLFTIIISILLTCIILVSLLYKTSKTFFKLKIPTLIILIIFLIYNFLLLKLT